MVNNFVLNYRLDIVLFFVLSFVLMGAAHFLRKHRGALDGMPFWTWAIWGLLMAATVFFAEYSGRQEKKQLMTLLEGSAPTYSREMERMGHDKITWDTAADNPVYLTLIEAEKRWLKSNTMISDIYTFGPGKDGRAVLLVDSETDYNRNGQYDEVREQRTPIGEDFPLQNEQVKAAMAGKKQFESNPYTDRWGTWVSFYHPIRDTQGKVLAVLGVDYPAHDWIKAIIENRFSVLAFSFMVVIALIGYGLADAKIRSRDRYFKALIENAQDIVTVMDLTGKLLFESPSIRKVLGYEPDELIGKNGLELVHPEDFPAVAQAFQRTIQNPGQKVSVEFRFHHKNGSWVFLESVAVNFSQDRNIRGVIVNSRDISENKKAQEELEFQRVRAAQASKMASLGEMASGIAHEVNTPLGVIIGRAEQLKGMVNSQNPDLKQIGVCAEGIQEMTLRIAKIIRSLRAFSRDASHDPFVRTQLSAVVDDVVAICSERFRNNGVKLEVGKVPDLAFDCRGPEIAQVLLNLLNNAFDAVREAGVKEKKVSLMVSSENESVFLKVKDSGPGIPEGLREKIFEPFFTTKEIGKGTGLGLSICKGIVDSHGGEISVLNETGGCCFQVRLPRLHLERAA